MGAATTTMYSHSDNRIDCICLDSPFSDFSKLAKELCKKQISIPNFVIDTALAIISKTIKNKNGLDIYKLVPEVYASKTYVPGFFVHAMNDDLIPLEHSLALFEEYGGEKSLNICEGNHNSTRQKHILDKIGKFFAKYLCVYI